MALEDKTSYEKARLFIDHLQMEIGQRRPLENSGSIDPVVDAQRVIYETVLTNFGELFPELDYRNPEH